MAITFVVYVYLSRIYAGYWFRNTWSFSYKSDRQILRFTFIVFRYTYSH